MFLIKSKHLNLLIILILSLFLVNCQKNRVVKSHGIIFLDKRETLLKPNITNKNDVISVLGEPHIKSIHEKNTWIYIERTRTKGKIYKVGKNVLLNNNVLVVKFDEYGILNEKLFYDKNKMNTVKFSEEITENVVTRGSFLQSFVSSLRSKINQNRGLKKN
tara:strand:+ start:337 stop:819 length:483 start_codon:yes stop_codon:yes gene_type:complete